MPAISAALAQVRDIDDAIDRLVERASSRRNASRAAAC